MLFCLSAVGLCCADTGKGYCEWTQEDKGDFTSRLFFANPWGQSLLFKDTEMLEIWTVKDLMGNILIQRLGDCASLTEKENGSSSSDFFHHRFSIMFLSRPWPSVQPLTKAYECEWVSESFSVVSNILQPPGYTVYGILQARILEWIAFPSSRVSSNPRYQTQASCIVGGFFTRWVTREALWISM